MASASTIQTLTQLSYLVAAALFILGLKRMSSPVTAVSGVRWAGLGVAAEGIGRLIDAHAQLAQQVVHRRDVGQFRHVDEGLGVHRRAGAC